LQKRFQQFRTRQQFWNVRLSVGERTAGHQEDSPEDQEWRLLTSEHGIPPDLIKRMCGLHTRPIQRAQALQMRQRSTIISDKLAESKAGKYFCGKYFPKLKGGPRQAEVCRAAPAKRAVYSDYSG
jgi:hypothetical protein